MEAHCALPLASNFWVVKVSTTQGPWEIHLLRQRKNLKSSWHSRILLWSWLGFLTACGNLSQAVLMSPQMQLGDTYSLWLAALGRLNFISF
jgi:hypothetical protein